MAQSNKPVIKVKDIAWVRLKAPDLDAQERFLTDFGMVRSARTRTRLLMRGTDGAHHVHVTEKGDRPAFVGFAFYARREQDLHRLAEEPGVSRVKDLREPGGGKVVTFREYNGFQIEVVHGIEKLAKLPVRRNVVNTARERYRRTGNLTRLPKGPSQVKRIGHGVIGTPDLRASIDFLRPRLGLVCTDEVYAGAKDNVIATFNRVDDGRRYVDHHVFLYIQMPAAGLNHASYEVQDTDDVLMGREHLEDTGLYEPMWGPGRHVLGSQVFDYWCDPWDRVHEHFTDTDVFNVGHRARVHDAEDGLNSQWGAPIPQRFVTHATP